MAITPSLGEAISLQGRNQGAEQLGRLAFQQGEAEKNRQLKGQLAKAKTEGENQDQLYKLFNDKTNFHRLVQPKFKTLIEKVTADAQAIQSSDSPYRSNEFNKIIADAYVQMSELKTRSEAFKSFDAKTSMIDKNKAFFGPQTEEFINTHYKDAKDYEDLAARIKNSNFKFDGNLALTEDGIPLFNPEPIENYQSNIAALAKSIKPSVTAEFVTSLPYDKKQMRGVYVRPFKREDAKAAYDNNKSLFPQGPPVSVEDVVDNYMLSNPRAVDQYVSRNRLNVERDPQTGMYSPEDEKVIREGMMNFAIQYSNPEMKDKVVGKPGSFSISVGDKVLQSPLAPQPSRQILSFGVPGEKVEGKAVPENQRNKNYQVNQVGVDYRLKAEGVSVQPSNKVFDRYNNSMSKSLKDQTVENIITMPYKMVVVDGQSVPRIAYADEPGKVEGLMPFVKIGSAGETYFTPLKGFAYDELAGTKFDLEKLSVILNEMITRSENASKAVRGKGYNTNKVFDILDLYYKK